MEKLIPDYRFHRVADITSEDIDEMEIKGIAIDLDNTLVFDGTSDAIDGVHDWIQMIAEKGIPICVLTNTHHWRAKKISDSVNIEKFVPWGIKPGSMGYKRAAKKLGITCREMAVIGDQIFADVKGANAVGAVSVYIDPIVVEKRYAEYFRIRRKKEKPILEEFERRKRKSDAK